MIELPKGDLGQRGAWRPIVAHQNNGPTIRKAIVGCPTCGREVALPGSAISDDGSVPSPFVCPEGCGTRTQVKLVGWDPNAA